MVIWIIRLMVVLAGPVIGYLQISQDAKGILIGTGVAIFIIFVEIIIEQVALDTMVAGVIGIILGLVAAKMVDYSVALMENPLVDTFFKSYSLLLKIVFAYIGMVLAIKKKDELDLLDKNILPSGKKLSSKLKILDTSVIIDGRIVDICNTKFIEGTLVIPSFVLKELNEIADSQDPIVRAKGRRGLDILKKLRENKNVNIKIFEKEYPKIKEVDVKIVKLAEELKAKIITSDFNLNKIASLQGLNVLNVNELSNAIKPLVIPGELIKVFILKEGKEHQQGVAYLDDGTMVVVENGRNSIGKNVEVVVSSILQTSAGRMVFARIEK